MLGGPTSNSWCVPAPAALSGVLALCQPRVSQSALDVQPVGPRARRWHPQLSFHKTSGHFCACSSLRKQQPREQLRFPVGLKTMLFWGFSLKTDRCTANQRRLLCNPRLLNFWQEVMAFFSPTLCSPMMMTRAPHGTTDQ